MVNEESQTIQDQRIGRNRLKNIICLSSVEIEDISRFWKTWRLKTNMLLLHHVFISKYEMNYRPFFQGCFALGNTHVMEFKKKTVWSKFSFNKMSPFPDASSCLNIFISVNLFRNVLMLTLSQRSAALLYIVAKYRQKKKIFD